MMVEDQDLAPAAAPMTGTPSPLGAVAVQLHQLLGNQGLGKKDFSVIMPMLEPRHDGGDRSVWRTAIKVSYRPNWPVMS
jgi:hypothetical protein